MIVQRYHRSFKKNWNDFLSQSKNGTFLFDRNYMEYHSSRFEDFSLIVFKENKIIALLPANIKDNIIYSHQGLSYGGVITTQKTTFKDAILIYNSILNFLYEAQIENLNIKLLPSFYTPHPSSEDTYFMYLLEAKKTRCDVTLTINQQHKLGFSSNKKRKIKAAQKENLTIVQSENYNEFWNEVLIPNLRDTHNLTPVHSLEEIELLHKYFTSEIILYSVYQDSKIIAGSVLYLTEEVVHAQYISANEKGKETGALDFLFDYLINKKYVNKSTFDFGVVNQGKGINLGLTYWKEGFGARTYTHDFYQIKTSNRRLLSKIITT